MNSPALRLILIVCPQKRWIDAAEEAMVSVVDQHQKTLRGTAENKRRLTVGDLIRPTREGGDRSASYATKVRLEFPKGVVVLSTLDFI